jgi:hypothetical protein
MHIVSRCCSSTVCNRLTHSHCLSLRAISAVTVTIPVCITAQINIRVGLPAPENQYIHGTEFTHYAYVTYMIASALVQVLFIIELVVEENLRLVLDVIYVKHVRVSLRYKPTYSVISGYSLYECITCHFHLSLSRSPVQHIVLSVER